MTMTLSPQSIWGVYVGLCLPRRRVAIDGGEAADDQAFGVDQHPLLLDLGRFGRIGCHDNAPRPALSLAIGPRV